MKRTYLAVFERVADDNWGGWVPDIGGAVGAGETLELARQSLLEGMEIMLADLDERGLPPPAATSTGVDFAALTPAPSSHYVVEWLTIFLPEERQTISEFQAA